MASTQDSVEVIFGAATLRPGLGPDSAESIQSLFPLLERANIRRIDTAAAYGTSEELLGQSRARERFIISTKTTCGFKPGEGGKEASILRDAGESWRKLGTCVDIFCLHAPDHQTPLEETLRAVHHVYQLGFFQRFGLSNFQARDVEEIYSLCKASGYVLPTVYQGSYSAITRLPETTLLPTLRKLGISFHAYSPSAGGFLAKTKEEVLRGAGRFNNKNNAMSKLYTEMYADKQSLTDALVEWNEIATMEGCSKAELAYRWIRYHSQLSGAYEDAMVIGSSSVAQLKDTLDALGRGPLSASAAEKIDAMWNMVKAEAPHDFYHRQSTLPPSISGQTTKGSRTGNGRSDYDAIRLTATGFVTSLNPKSPGTNVQDIQGTLSILDPSFRIEWGHKHFVASPAAPPSIQGFKTGPQFITHVASMTPKLKTWCADITDIVIDVGKRTAVVRVDFHVFGKRGRKVTNDCLFRLLISEDGSKVTACTEFIDPVAFADIGDMMMEPDSKI